MVKREGNTYTQENRRKKECDRREAEKIVTETVERERE